mmetsp:Transcript_7064/g.10125  ORF Transcript_7064/g.10125 Transcript_7064/m.10125 type:complete len:190 (+) Transcript_7064:1625-2194(+)
MTFAGITCYLCIKEGYYSSSCPLKIVLDKAKEDWAKKSLSADQQFYNGVKMESDKSNFNNSDADSSDDDDSSTDGSFNVMWTARSYYRNNVKQKYMEDDILLYTGSTGLVFKNKNLLLNIKKANGKLRAFTNGSWQDSTEVGMVPGFFPVWYNPKSRLNIFTYADVRKKYRITSDTIQETAFTQDDSED